MRDKIMVHGIWLLVALLAFALGYRRHGLVGKSAPADVSRESLLAERTLAFKGEKTAGAGAEEASLTSAGEQELSDEEIEAIGKLLRETRSPVEKRLAFSKLLAGLTKDNALLVREQIEHMDQRSAEFREFHYAWGGVAGAEAALFGAATEEDDMSPALAGWANADPAAALDWFKALNMESDEAFDPLLKDRKIPADQLKGHLMRGLVQGLASANPDTATAFVLSEVENEQRGAEYLMHMVAEEKMRGGKASETVGWAESLPEGTAREVALRRVADRFVDEDPAAAAEWASAYADGSESAGVIAEVGANWMHKDPGEAMAWLSELPEGPGQERGMHRALREWAGRDAAAASEYLAEMPASAAKDAAIGGFSRRLVWEDPGAAIAWAETISADGERTEALIDAGRAWMRKDAQGAADWVASSGLSEQAQQAILSPRRERDDR